MNPPVFILAAPFCGASWLAAMLGCHPQLYALPQLHLFMADTVGELLDIFELGQGGHADGLLRAVAELEFGGQSDATVTQAREWLREHAALRGGELLALFAARVAPRRLVIAEADSPLRPHDLRRMQRQVPAARLLHLRRHPWSQGCVLAAYLRERLFVPRDYRDHAVQPARIDPQIPWLRANLNIERLLAAVPEGATSSLRSESLDENPTASLSTICRWLGIESTNAELAAMQRPDEWPFAGYGPRLAPYGLEEEVLENLPGHAVALAQHPTLNESLPWLDPSAPFAAEVIELAQRYGYR